MRTAVVLHAAPQFRFTVMSLNSRLTCLLFGCWALVAGPALADPVRIAHLLRVQDLFPILQKEGGTYGSDLLKEMSGMDPDAAWAAEVAKIHDPERLMPAFREDFGRALTGADEPAIEAWLDTPLGRRVVGLELQTREALLDPALEDRAIQAAEEADAADDPRLAAVRRVIAASDLVETNVIGGLNANLAFYRAMAAGNAFPYEVTEADMLADVAAQEEDIRADVTAWLEGYLFAAYGALSLDELQQLAQFNASAAGQELLRAEFTAFDRIYESTSAALGAALARRLTSADL